MTSRVISDDHPFILCLLASCEPLNPTNTTSNRCVSDIVIYRTSVERYVSVKR